MAEYKEITRPFNKVLKRIADKTMHQVTIPPTYRLGTGHETFFFDKLKWLHNRYHELYTELVARSFNINHEQFDEISFNLQLKLQSTPYWNDYHPTHEAIYINMGRLAERYS